MSLCLFVACNQSRHMVSDSHRKKDTEFAASYKKKIDLLNSTASKLLGKPYKLGSSGPKSFDCSGFTSRVFESIQMSLPRMATDQARMGHAIKMDFVKEGDLLFFGGKTVDHVALVTKVKSSKITIIHATTSLGVTRQILQDSEYWMKRFKFGRRVII